MRNKLEKKDAMNELISVAVMVLVIAVLFGMTFLFTASLKSQVRIDQEELLTITNETGARLNRSGYELGVVSTDSLARSFVIVTVYNGSNGEVIDPGNYTISSAGVLTNTSTLEWDNVNLTYTYLSAIGSTSWISVNSTETSSSQIVDYLPLVFLSLIFGAILTIVLRIILPYVNLGRQFNSF